MKNIVIFSFLLATRIYSQEITTIDVKLIEIESSKDGALVKKWEKTDVTGVNTNEIFVQNLPESIATGDVWSGKIQRKGAFTKSDGSKIPSYQVENSGSRSEIKKEIMPTEQIPNISKLVFVVKSEESSGTCFLMNDGKDNYIYSNLHVFSGSTNSVIKNAEQQVIPIPDIIEVAHGHDLLRFKSNEQQSLQIGDLPTIDEAVETYGNSQGTGVITKNIGKVLGVGDSSIEVSCEIVPGNSGGPIINKSGKVVGIASYLNKRDEDQWNEGTRYEKTRRFGIRIDQPIKWEALKYSEFKKDSVLLEAINEALDTIVSCVLSIDHNKMMMTFTLPKTLPSSQRAQAKLDNVVRYHNKEYCNDYTNKKVKDMIAYMYTQLKEATEVVVEDNRSPLNSEWAKESFNEIKSRKDRISVLMVKHREDANKSF